MNGLYSQLEYRIKILRQSQGETFPACTANLTSVLFQMHFRVVVRVLGQPQCQFMGTQQTWWALSVNTSCSLLSHQYNLTDTSFLSPVSLFESSKISFIYLHFYESSSNWFIKMKTWTKHSSDSFQLPTLIPKHYVKGNKNRMQ